MPELIKSKLKAYGKETVLQFIQGRIKENDDFERDILDKITYVRDTVSFVNDEVQIDLSSRGFYYERLWDLCIKFGVTDLTMPSSSGIHLQTSHIINENPNQTASLVFHKNCWQGNALNMYLNQPVRSGSSGGYSDITFINKEYGTENETLYFISVKYFQEARDISKYDIDKLCALLREHEKKNRTIKIFIFVKDKNSVISKFKAANQSSNILIKYISPNGNYENIYDIRDLRKYYFKLKLLLNEFNYLERDEDVQRFEKDYLKVLKSLFIPRFHQELFILKLNELIEKGEKNMLVGAIPRSGKSYIMAGTILDYIKKTEIKTPGKKAKMIIMTPAPNETFGEYSHIFNSYIDFQNLGIQIVEHKGNYDAKLVCKNKDKHCIIIISKQKLGWSDSSKKTNEDSDLSDLENIQINTLQQRITTLIGHNPDIDILFLDEAHFGMSTAKAQQIVATLNSTVKDTVKVYVTATYNKPLQAYGVKSECKLTWDINDINIMKNINITTINDNSIKQRFGSRIYTNALEYYGDKTGKSLVNRFSEEYSMYPKPYLITSLWDKDFLNTEKLKIDGTDFGWDMGKLFSTREDSDEFSNEEQVKEMMRYYFGKPDREESYDKQVFYRTRGIIPRIKKICLNECRTLQQNHKTTQLWFLPVGTGKIEYKVKALIKLLTNANEFKDIKKTYHFYVAVAVDHTSSNVGVTYMKNPQNIKKEIEDVEQKLKEGHDGFKQDNLIILAGNRLQLGISLRNVDIVSLWNSISSEDAIFQMLFRSMTEVSTLPCTTTTHEFCEEKKFGFMVDMNPQRAFTNVSLFSQNISRTDKDDNKRRFQQITDLINIDSDVFKDKFGDSPTQKQREEYSNELFNKLYESWNVNVKNIQKVVSKFTYDMSKLESLRKDLIAVTRSSRSGKKDEEDPEDKLPPGKKRSGVGTASTKSKKGTKDINLIDNASEIIGEYITLLNIFTLYDDTGAKCILIDGSNSNSQVEVIGNVNKLRDLVFRDVVNKDIFLKILNGRLTGNSETPYPVNLLENILETITDTNDKQIINKIVMTQKRDFYSIHEPEKLLGFINGELKPKDKERKEHGEIFTPVWLVQEMLDKLDNSYKKLHGKSIFSEPHFRWLDPAVGIGNYPIIIYLRLMEGLKHLDAYKDEEVRRKHIIEEMLYMVEISEKSLFILDKVFCGDKYKLNIHHGSFLEKESCKEWDFKFDVILGNPPYNPPKTETGSSGNSIWPHFVIKSYYLVKDSGFLLFIHPPGWKKPTNEVFNPEKLAILDGDYYRIDKKTGKRTGFKQIRQGLVWQLFRENGNFSFIYTNDQKNKKIGNEIYIPYFPAVDYYVYQKKGLRSSCDTKNIFLGEVRESKEVRLNYELNYLPNLITNQTQHILYKVTSKEGEKPEFQIFRDKPELFFLDSKDQKYKYIYTFNRKKEPQYKYSNTKSKDDNVNLNKVILNYDGGIDNYSVVNISKEDQIGSYHMTMYSKVYNKDEGLHITNFFKSDIVKFIFLITQYASGKMTKNEKLVANSITLPPIGTDDYYKFFGIEADRAYIEKTLAHFYGDDMATKDTTSSSSEIESTKCEYGKIYNPKTKRCIKDTPANRKKIDSYKSTVKKGGFKKSNKNSTLKHNK